MEQNFYEAIRGLPRHQLEALVLRAADQLRRRRSEAELGTVFAALLAGFLMGAVVAASGFLLGARLG